MLATLADYRQLHILLESVQYEVPLIGYNRVYARLTGNAEAGLLLGQMVYWSQRGAPDGWFCKSYADWEHELGLKAAEVRYLVQGHRRWNASGTGAYVPGRLARWVEFKIGRQGRTPGMCYRVQLPVLVADVARLLGMEAGVCQQQAAAAQ